MSNRAMSNCAPLVAMLTIARFTVIDAIRSRWLWLVAASVASTLIVATFAGGMALTERASVMLAAGAPLARIQAVLMMIVLSIAGLVREIHERSMLLMMAAPISRTQWLLGKLLGMLLVAWVTAALSALPLLALQATPNLWLWFISLACELAIVVLVALLLAFALRQMAVAALTACAFYAAARLIGVILLINERAPLELHGADAIVTATLKAVAVALPRFDLFTQTDWLMPLVSASPVSGLPSMAVLAPVLLQTGIFMVLLLVIAALDFSRSEL
jgi:ABC-type transport system involved in multi-copper enzyme maturation permease subunit